MKRNYTKVHKGNDDGTLETTIPSFAAGVMAIHEGDTVEWGIEVHQGTKVLQIRKVEDALGGSV